MTRMQRIDEMPLVTQEELTPAESDNETIAESILAEAENSADNVSWFGYVAKVEKGNQEARLLQFDPVNEMIGLEQQIRDEYGSGDYRIRIYKKEGNTPKRIYKQWQWKIVAKPRAQAIPERGSEMGTVLAAIERQNERIAQLIERIMTPQQQVPAVLPSDPFASLERIVSVMTGLNGIMQPKNQSLDVVSAILKGVELAKSVEGNGGRETNWQDLVSDFLKSPIAEAMAAQQMVTLKQPNETRAGLQAPPQPRASSPPDTTQVKEKPFQTQAIQEDHMKQQIMNSIGYLVQVAGKNGDPQLYADWVLDNWPRDLVISVLQQPNAIALLTQFVPAANAYIPWFQKLIEELREMLKDEAATQAGPRNVSPEQSPVNSHGNPGRPIGGENDLIDDDEPS